MTPGLFSFSFHCRGGRIWPCDYKELTGDDPETIGKTRDEPANRLHVHGPLRIHAAADLSTTLPPRRIFCICNNLGVLTKAESGKDP
jgi:hypothetical protein